AAQELQYRPASIRMQPSGQHQVCGKLLSPLRQACEHHLGSILGESWVAQLTQGSRIDQAQMPANKLGKGLMVIVCAIPPEQGLIVHRHSNISMPPRYRSEQRILELEWKASFIEPDT